MPLQTLKAKLAFSHNNSLVLHRIKSKISKLKDLRSVLLVKTKRGALFIPKVWCICISSIAVIVFTSSAQPALSYLLVFSIHISLTLFLSQMWPFQSALVSIWITYSSCFFVCLFICFLYASSILVFVTTDTANQHCRYLPQENVRRIFEVCTVDFKYFMFLCQFTYSGFIP